MHEGLLSDDEEVYFSCLKGRGQMKQFLILSNLQLKNGEAPTSCAPGSTLRIANVEIHVCEDHCCKLVYNDNSMHVIYSIYI